MRAILQEIEAKGGIGILFCDTARRAKATRFALEALGLHSYPKTPARSMTTIDDVNAKEIRDLLKTEFGVNVAGGQDHLKGKIFRVAHMGYINEQDLLFGMLCLDKVLREMGFNPKCSLASKLGEVLNESSNY